MTFTGVVTGGSARASALGCPTANIPLTQDVSGVFVAEVEYAGTTYPAVAFADPARKLLEAHLFDFSEDLYTKEITVTLLEKVRDTKVFPDDASLREAMVHDVAQARAYFA